MSEKPNVVVFSGSGLSQESGIPTFRASDGLWHDHKVEDVAEHGAWKRNPQVMLDFYAARFQNIKDVQPNEAHKAIARLEEKFNVLNVTQNIDDLLERAGCTNVWHLHGSINDRKCEKHKGIIAHEYGFNCLHQEKNHAAPVKMGDLCPACGGQMRPDVVWFGESVDMRGNFLENLAENTYAFIGIGTSAQVQPAAGLLFTFRVAKKKYFVDLKPPERLQSYTRLAGTATEHLPKLVDDLLNEQT